jgi:sugar-phosphatase
MGYDRPAIGSLGHDDRGNGRAGTVLSCRGVLFDCDGVLVDSLASVASAWGRWAGGLGLDPEAVSSLVHGRRSVDTVALLVPEPQRARQLALIDRYEIEDAATVRAIAGAAALLESLSGAPWAVVTSGRTELARARLRAAGLPYPAQIVTADDVAQGKPDPEGYRTAAARLGIAPSETVVVEDQPVGIRAARAAGAGAVVGVGLLAVGAGADLVVPDLRSLRWTAGGLEVVVPTLSPGPS